MINLYQWYYKNIWPLKNKSVLVNYKHKNVLVKAPIWTWKSFLFFDWPLFWLYKYSDRTIINQDSKNWTIQILFSVDNNYFLIIRNITRSKTWKDSTKSSLYEIISDKNLIDYLDNFSKIIDFKDNDILTLLKFNQIWINDLTQDFKQESILQNNLNDLLPPKEVAITTIFLPQNSENIFEMIPSQRVNILKKIFWILWIDEAKKIIDEEKLKIYWELKSIENTTSYMGKISEILRKISLINFDIIKIKELDIFLSDFELIDYKKLNLDKLTNLNIDFNPIFEILKNKNNKFVDLENKLKNIDEKIKLEKSYIKKLSENLKNIEKQLLEVKDIPEEVTKLENKIKNIDKDILKLENKYNNLDVEYEKALKNNNQLENLNKEMEKIKNEMIKLKSKKTFLENKFSDNILNEIKNLENRLFDLNKQLEQFLDIKYESFYFENKTISSLEELKELILYIENEWKNYAKNITELKNEIKELTNNILNLEKNKKIKWNYFCKKISWNCPFIEEILNKFDNSFEIIEKQKQIMINKKKLLEEKLNKNIEKRNNLANWWKKNNINDIKTKLEKIQKIQVETLEIQTKLKNYKDKQNEILHNKWQLNQILDDLENYNKNILDIETQINKLNNKNYKVIFNDYNLYKKLKENKENMLKNLNQYSSKIKESIKLKTEKDQILNNLSEKKTLLNELEKEKNNLILKYKEIENIKNLAISDEKKLLNLKELVTIYNNVLDEYNNNKLKIIKIRKKYKILKDLSNIFWKELVIYVFSDYLKSLEELINYFISDIVNFMLHIQLDEKWESLEIFVEDELWKRNVNSLSGWQKTALRIWWILAISKLQNNKMLFLDETINNFDQESIWLLANKIKEFVGEQNIKFYMITHSEILQQTNIWDEIINLKIN